MGSKLFKSSKSLPTSVVRYQHMITKFTQYLLTLDAYLSSEYEINLGVDQKNYSL